MTWARKRAIDVHNETAGYFSTEYASQDVYDSPFRYGRSLLDAQWQKVVANLPAGSNCLDVGSGIGVYMIRLIGAGFKVRGIEPSAEMRKLARRYVPEELVSDGSVIDLPVADQSQDFIYAIEVFRYLDSDDNEVGHREIFRVLKPGGFYFGSYVNALALDGYRQYVAFERLRNTLVKRIPRYHVEFETIAGLKRKLAVAGFEEIVIRGAMFAPLRLLHKLAPKIATRFSRWTMPREAWLSDHRLTRQCAGHLLVIARRKS
jgi:putative AdoMet-dependent methyltransferase